MSFVQSGKPPPMNGVVQHAPSLSGRGTAKCNVDDKWRVGTRCQNDGTAEGNDMIVRWTRRMFAVLRFPPSIPSPRRTSPPFLPLLPAQPFFYTRPSAISRRDSMQSVDGADGFRWIRRHRASHTRVVRNGVQESAIAIKRVTGRRFFDEKLDISSCLMLQLGVCLVQRTIQRWSCFFRRERSSKSLAVLEETSCYQTLSL